MVRSHLGHVQPNVQTTTAQSWNKTKATKAKQNSKAEQKYTTNHRITKEVTSQTTKTTKTSNGLYKIIRNHLPYVLCTSKNHSLPQTNPAPKTNLTWKMTCCCLAKSFSRFAPAKRPFKRSRSTLCCWAPWHIDKHSKAPDISCCFVHGQTTSTSTLLLTIATYHILKTSATRFSPRNADCSACSWSPCCRSPHVETMGLAVPRALFRANRPYESCFL